MLVPPSTQTNKTRLSVALALVRRNGRWLRRPANDTPAVMVEYTAVGGGLVSTDGWCEENWAARWRYVHNSSRRHLFLIGRLVMVSDYDADEDGSGQDESIDQRLSPSAIWVETIASAACGSGKTTIAGGGRRKNAPYRSRGREAGKGGKSEKEKIRWMILKSPMKAFG